MLNIKVRQIARELGLAPSTVSKALRGTNTGVSSETARRVLSYCVSNKHFNDYQAGTLLLRIGEKSRGSQIFCITHRSGLSMYDEVFHGICDKLRENHFYPSLYTLDREGVNNFPFNLASIAVVLGRVQSKVLEKLTENNIKTVVVDDKVSIPGVSCVNSNNLEAMTAAVEILIKKGHKRIAFLCNHEDQIFYTHTFHQRQLGYIVGHLNSGLPYDEKLLITGQLENVDEQGITPKVCFSSIRTLCRRILDLKPLPTAVIAVNDMHGYILRQVLNEAGLKVPEDISIIGYDGEHCLNNNQTIYAPISTMVVKWKLMGVEAVNMALSSLYDTEAPERHIEVPTTYEDAGTVAPPRE
jgi:DNA-binding LacI/PurR family transcriptional regulator